MTYIGISSILLLLFSFFMFILGIISNSVITILISVTVLVFSNFVFCTINIKKNILFFCFNTTYFIFLVGRMFVSTFLNYKIELRGLNGLNFTDINLVIITLIAIYLSLLCIRIGYSFFINYNFNFLKRKNSTKFDRNSIEISALVLFYISIIFRLYIVFEMRNATINEGYFETFSIFKSSLPSILQTFGDMYDMFFFSYLACLPNKKNTIFPVFLYILEGGLAATSGRRSVFMLNLLIILIYFVIRNNKEKNDVWFGKKELLGSIVSLPIVLSLMTLIGQFRDSSGLKVKSNIFTSIKEFFYSQGVSANLIGYSKIYGDQIPRKIYTLGPIFEFINESILKTFTREPKFFGQTADRALNGYLFSQTLPYFIDSKAYLAGYGWGSSLVAENYVDGGFFGVIIGGLIYGLILVVLSIVITEGSFLFMTFGLAMSRIILFAPRAAYLSFIVSALSIRKIIAVLLVYLFSIVVRQLLKNIT